MKTHSLTLSVLLASASWCSLASAAEFISNNDFTDNETAYTQYPGYNGGFNPAQITDWTSGGGSGTAGLNGSGTNEGSSPFEPAGNPPPAFGFIQVNSAATSPTYLSQTINLASDTTYTLSLMAGERQVGYGSEGTMGAVSIINSVGGSEFSYNLDSVAATMTTPEHVPDVFTLYDDLTFTTGVIAPGSTTTIRLENTSNLAGSSADDHTIAFTDVHLTGNAPESSSYALVALGAGVAFFFLRRRTGIVS